MLLLSFLANYIHDILALEGESGPHLPEKMITELRKAHGVAEAIKSHRSPNMTFGERAADQVAQFGGSWAFILCFAFFCIVWMALNSVQFLFKPFDHYPFILLNLILSCLAAVQAPIILMSQNRIEKKDRLRAEYDYRVNRKAELEIRHIHMKIDQLLIHQWQRLMEIQQDQLALMEKLLKK